MDRASKFESEVLSFIKRQNYGAARIGVGPLSLRSDQGGNTDLAKVLIDLQKPNQQASFSNLNKIGGEIVESIKKISEEAILSSADDQKILLDQLRTFKELIPLVEEGTKEQKEAKNNLVALFNTTERALSKNSKFYNRFVEMAKGLLPSASGIVSGIASKSPMVGAIVNFALEKYQERSKAKTEAKKDAAKSLFGMLGSIYEERPEEEKEETKPAKKKKEKPEKEKSEVVESLESNEPIRLPQLRTEQERKEFAAGIDEGILQELESLNEEEMGALRKSLAELLEIDENTLNSVEQIRNVLAPLVSEEASLEAERQMEEQNGILKGIAEKLGGDESKPEKSGIFGGLFSNFDFTDLWAAWSMFKGALVAAGAFMTRIGTAILSVVARIGALPILLTAGIVKGVYDGIKKYIEGGSLKDSLMTALEETGNFLTLGLARKLGEYLGETEILDPVFNAYDNVVGFVSDSFDKIAAVSKDIWEWVSNPIASAKNVYIALNDKMVSLFENVKTFLNDPSRFAKNLFSNAKETIKNFFVELIPTWVPDKYLPTAIRNDVRKYRRGSDSSDLSPYSKSSVIEENENGTTTEIVWMDHPDNQLAPPKHFKSEGSSSAPVRRPRAVSSNPVEAPKNQSSPLSMGEGSSPLSMGEGSSPLSMGEGSVGLTKSQIDFLFETDRMLGLPDGYSMAQIKTESAFNSSAMSPAGAMGLAQVMPGTQRSLNTKSQFEKWKNDQSRGDRVGMDFDAFNQNDALLMHRILMQENMNRFGNADDAARAYNGGWDPSTWGNEETSAYAGKIRDRIGDMPPILGDSSSADKKIETLQNVSQNVKQSEVISRAQIEAKTASVNINSKNTTQQSSSSTPVGGTSRPANEDQTLRHFTPVLV